MVTESSNYKEFLHMRRVTFLLTVLFFSCVALSAQTVDDIIAKSIAAKGGLAKLKAVQTIRATGDFEAGGMQAQFVRISKRPGKVRLDITIQGLNMVRAYDGKNGWQVIPFTGKNDPEPMDADSLKQMQGEADMDGALVDYKQKGHKVELVGKEKIEGTDAYHLKVTLKNGDVRHIYLDADSFLEIKATGKTTARGTEVDFESTVGDYKEVEGMMVPFSMQQSSSTGQMPPAKITITKIEFNVPIDDTKFNMPPPPPPAAAPPAEKSEPAPAGKEPPKPPAATKPPNTSN